MVAAGPGRSGADTLTRILGLHPTTVAADWSPALVAACIRMLLYCPSDGIAWLPRRAAQALTDVVQRFRLAGPAGQTAAGALIQGSSATTVHIAVYGTLLVPEQLPSSHWHELFRAALLACAEPPADGHSVFKVGPHLSRAVLPILSSTDVLLYAVRHPVETLITLTESAVDGMRPAEALHYMEICWLQFEHSYDASASPSTVIRLEQLIRQADETLDELISIAELTDDHCWRKTVRQSLPQDIRSAPQWKHPVVAPFKDRLSVLADAWGYR